MKTATATKLERIRLPFEVKSTDDEKHTFRGIAAAFSKDLGDDVIHPGAFKRTLEHWRRSKKDEPVQLLDSHDRFSVFSVLGKMLDAQEVDTGLDSEFDFIPEDEKAMAAWRRVKGRYVTKLSIGYEAVKFDFETPPGAKPWDRIRHLHEIKLIEVSLVLRPMNPDAVIDAGSIKSLLDAARAGQLTDEQKDELRALLSDPPTPPDEAPVDTPKGLAPDDPRRIELSERLRSLKHRSLTL